MIKIGLGTDLTGETTSSALGSPVHFSWLQGQHIEHARAVIVPTVLIETWQVGVAGMTIMAAYAELLNG
jgi:hypothetical protein